MIRRKEGTITVAILKEEKEEEVFFTGFISLTSGFRYLPPFLPNFKYMVVRGVYDGICEEYRDLLQKILQCSSVQNLRSLESKFASLGNQITNLLEGENGPLGFIMNKQLADIPYVVIFTNDPSIPWHLAYDTSIESSERKPITRFLQITKRTGTIFIQKMTDESSLPRIIHVLERARKNIYKSAEDGLKNKYFLFIRGRYNNRLDKIIDEEIEEITKIISSKYDVKIKIVDNWHDIKDCLLDDELTKDVELIYYSGHMDIVNDELHMILSDNESIPAHRVSQIRIRYESEPLVFLNSCFGGEIKDVLKKEANFSTSFLNNYASGCVVVTGPAEATLARDFAIKFFQRLFDDPANITYGDAISFARKELNYPPESLLFHLYGDPGAVLIYEEPEEKSLLETAGLVEYGL